MIRLLVLLTGLVLATTIAQAQAPDSLSFQGFLTDTIGNPLDSAGVGITFKLYKGTTEIWSETQSVNVSGGVFNVFLGTIEPLDTVAFNQPIDLGMTLGGVELLPRTPLVSSAFSLGMRGMYAYEREWPGRKAYNIVGGASNNYIGPLVVGGTISGGGGWNQGASFADSVLNDWATIGGGGANRVGSYGSTVSGGIENRVLGNFATVGGGWKNHIAGGLFATISGGYNNYVVLGAVSSTISGGQENRAHDAYSTVGGGNLNKAEDRYAFVGGGYNNRAAGEGSVLGGGSTGIAGGDWSFVGGGLRNQSLGAHSFVGGGDGNTASGIYSTVPGGFRNGATGDFSFAAGVLAQAKHKGTFVWQSPVNDTDSLLSTGEGQFIVHAHGGVGIGTNAPTSPLTVDGIIESKTGGVKFPDGSVQTTAAGAPSGWSLVGNAGTTPGTNFIGTTDTAAFHINVNSLRAGRIEPSADAADAANIIFGHSLNAAGATVVGATISGGGGQATGDLGNKVDGDFGTVAGGLNNQALGARDVVGGGYGNIASGGWSTVGGGARNEATGYRSVIAGGGRNAASGDSSTVAGGAHNTAGGNMATIGGGRGNTASEILSSVGGGAGNQANGQWSTIGGGNYNTAGGNMATIGGGQDNETGAYGATVGGGSTNTATGEYSTVQGGLSNIASGHYSTVPGGFDNRATGSYSLAAGLYARAFHSGTFVWADDLFEAFSSTGERQFLIRAGGGVGIGTNSPNNQLTVDGDANVTGNLGIRATAPIARLSIEGADTDSTGPTIVLGGDVLNQFESGRVRFVENAAANAFRGMYIHYDGSGNKLHIGDHPTPDNLNSSDVNAVTVERSTLHVGIQREDPVYPLHVGTSSSNGNGAHVTVTGTWASGSSREFKTDFEPIDSTTLLETLIALPITRWRYKGEEGVSHIGPVAEEFSDAFGLGHDERYITTVDADGVALAAIQGLYELIQKQQSEIERMRAVMARAGLE